MRVRGKPLSRSSLFVALFATAFVASSNAALGAAGAASSASASAWLRPVAGEVVEPFREPSGPYGEGHRGVDFDAPPGTPVRVAGGGTVVFAGQVAGSLHVVVAHGGDLRTSYSFLASLSVAAGQTVERGAVVGTSGGSGPGHAPGVLHFGLRRGDHYVDPMALFGPVDLTDLVRLVPADAPNEAPWPSADSVAADLQINVLSPSSSGSGPGGCGDGVPLIGDAISAACDAVEWLGDAAVTLVDAGLDVLRSLGEEAAALADRLESGLHQLIDALRTVAINALRRLQPLAPVLLDLIQVGRRFFEWLTRDCIDNAPAADGSGGSGDLVLVVQGLGSSLTARRSGDGAAVLEPHFRFDPTALGYAPSDVNWFSYSPHGRTYGAEDTYRDLHESAALLARQLQALGARQPQRPVDLIAHSQGGVVVDLFLQDHYRGHEADYPAIGHVITLASPHRGAPLATTADQLRASGAGRLVPEAADELGLPANAPAVRQLSEYSETIRHLWDHGLPPGVDFTTIGGSEDLLVPADHIDVPGAKKAVVDVGGITPTDDHSGIGADPDALRAMRSALEGRAVPCTDLLDGIREAVVPVLTSRIEHLGM